MKTVIALICFAVLSGCSTSPSQDDDRTNAGNYVKRAERIADAMPRGSSK